VSEDPIDREVLARLDFGDPPGEVLGMLLDTFLEHSPGTAAKLAAAASPGDVEAAAHSLKSSVRQYGGMALGDSLESIELAAAAGTVDPAAVAAAVADFEQVRAALAEVRAGL
jgi:hypothetical protein